MRRASSGWLWLPVSLIGLWRIALSPSLVGAWPGGQYSDLLITHLPNAEFIHRALAAWHQIPLWNPTILSGMPLVGDPLAGLWYPPLWLAIAFPSPAAFNLLVWLHLAWAGLGMVRLARLEGLSRGGGWIAGAVLAASPKLLGQFGLGHVTLVMAVCWTPWVLAAVHRLIGNGDETALGGRGRAVKAGTLLGVVFLADPRWLIPCLLLAGALWLRQILRMRHETAARWRTWVTATVLVGGQSVLVAAWLAWPMWTLVSLSTRAQMNPSQSAVLSLPIRQLAGLIVPDLGGWPEWMTYAGLASLLLAVLAIVNRRAGRWFWLAIAAAGWVLALGDQTPAYSLLVQLVPGMSWLRVPARFLFVAVLALAMLAGIGWDSLSESTTAAGNRRLNLFGAGWVAVFATLLGAGLLLSGAWATPGVRQGLIVAGLAGSVGGALLLGRRRLASRHWLPLIAWLGLILVELAGVDGTLLEARPVSTIPAELSASLGKPTGLEGGTRLFSPSYSLPQDAASRRGLELADGVNPLQLESYWEFMSQATGFAPDSYSVTLPPFPSGDPRQAWPARLDAQQLGWLAVTRVVSAYPLQVSGLALVTQTAGEYVYANQEARPRAWVQPGTDIVPSSPWTQAVVSMWSPNVIQIEAKGSGRLILSEIAFPGWTARVDGDAQPIEAAGGLLRSVRLGAGQHQIEFDFRPWPAFLGAGLSLLGLALAVAAWWPR